MMCSPSGSGIGSSPMVSTSGPPFRCLMMARMGNLLPSLSFENEGHAFVTAPRATRMRGSPAQELEPIRVDQLAHAPHHRFGRGVRGVIAHELGDASWKSLSASAGSVAQGR